MKKIDLSHWYLNLPDGTNILTDELADGFQKENIFFRNEQGGLVFIVPNQGVSTKNSSYTRTELRELVHPDFFPEKFKHDINNWVSSSASIEKRDTAGAVDGTLWARLRIDAVSTTGEEKKQGKLIIGQIHTIDSNNPLCKLYYEKKKDQSGVLYVKTGFGDDSQHTLATGIDLGTVFVYRIKLVGYKIAVSCYRDKKIADLFFDIPEEFINRRLYFKAGCYNQNNTGDDYCQATFFGLEIHHP